MQELIEVDALAECDFGGGIALAKDVRGADSGGLRVRAGLALEAERVLEVERDHGILCVAQHEVTERADGEMLGDGTLLGRLELCVPGSYFLGSRLDERVDK